MTAELNSIMSEKSGDSESEIPDHRWQINDNCVVKHGNNWVRAIIEEMKPDSDRCKVCCIVSGSADMRRCLPM